MSKHVGRHPSPGRPKEPRTEFDQLRADVDAVEKRVAREIDPGLRAMVIAVLVLIVALALTLPQAGAARGFDILTGDQTALDQGAALPHRVFVWLSLVFSVGFSVLALITRRWAIAWVALAGSAVACVLGMLAIWSRQTLAKGLPHPAHAGGIGYGLIIGWIAVVLLTYHWLKVVWTRTALQSAADERKRTDSGLQWRSHGGSA